MNDVTQNIPQTISHNSGYHKKCHRDYFRDGNRALAKERRSGYESSRAKRKSLDKPVLFGKYCIFCYGERAKQVSGNKYELQKFIVYGLG